MTINNFQLSLNHHTSRQHKMPLEYVPADKGKAIKPPLISADNAFLGDVLYSKQEPEKQLSAGFYRQEKGTPLNYTYTYVSEPLLPRIRKIS